MWRSILLGKLTVSILASFIVGGFCIMQPRNVDLSVMESARWTGLGVFFLVLGVAQVVVVFLLFKKKK